MPKIKYEEECKFKGVVFKKGEIFYADRGQSERGWWEYYGRRWGVVICFLVGGFILGPLRWFILFGSIKPRNRRLFVNGDYIGRKGGSRHLFSTREITSLVRKNKVTEVRVLKKEGEVQIYSQSIIVKKAYVGKILNIGKIEEVYCF